MPQDQLQRPSYAKRFRPEIVKELLNDVLRAKLDGKSYSEGLAAQWTDEIAGEIKTKCVQLRALSRPPRCILRLFRHAKSPCISAFHPSPVSS